MGTYAPKSPDLSSFYSAGPTSEASAPASAPQNATVTGAQPQQLPSQQLPSQFSPQQRLHLQPPPNTYFPGAPAVTQQRISQAQQQTHQQQSPTYSPYLTSPAGQTVSQAGPGYNLSRQPQKAPFYQPYDAPYKPQFPVPASHFYGQGSGTTPTTGTSAPPGLGQGPPDPLSAVIATPTSALGPMPPKRGGSAVAGSSTAAAVDPSPVRTKFPTARIKRIMQADEEVGKVAQQTPIAVGKALEMFMVALVTKSADVAREKNSKRVSAQMLKQVVESDDQWDFLRDIVGRVENDEKGGGRARAAKAESESEEEPAEKKRRVGRKKKAA